MTWQVVPQDEAWVKQAKKNLTALYENKPLERMPFEFQHYDITGEFKPVMGNGARTTVYKTMEEMRRDVFDTETLLKQQLDTVAKRVRDGFWDDTVLAIQPLDGSQCWFPEIFGAKTHWFPNRPPFVDSLIFEAKDIDRLRPDFTRGEQYRASIEQIRFFRGVVGDRIPIGMPDMQSPVDFASMIMDYTQLVYAMMDDPKRVHALMRMITDMLIQAIHAFQKEMAVDYPGAHFNWWMPKGVFMADDLQAVLSPELYKEFAVPYNELIAREFGGLGLHSCGKILHNIDAVSATKGLYVLNTHDRLADVAPIVKNRCAVILGGIFKVIANNYPANDRLSCKTADELEALWFEDCSRLPEIKGQRVLYQCHALLSSKRTARDAYELILKVSRDAVIG